MCAVAAAAAVSAGKDRSCPGPGRIVGAVCAVVPQASGTSVRSVIFGGSIVCRAAMKHWLASR
jgi:hypothetical protein